MKNHPVYDSALASGDDRPWIDTADTARLIRSALGAKFPGTKFWVRSSVYSGGSSIRVYYDGIVTTPEAPYGLLVLVDYDGNVLDPTPVVNPDYSLGRWGHLPKPGAPSKRDVEAVVAGFSGKDFDGMIDMAYYKDSWLMPDGSAAFGASPGTEGSHGMHPGYDFPAPKPGAVKVHFGASYVFVEASVPYGTKAA